MVSLPRATLAQPETTTQCSALIVWACRLRRFLGSTSISLILKPRACFKTVKKPQGRLSVRCVICSLRFPDFNCSTIFLTSWVEERTQELKALYQELQRKEETRGELLRKVISVQEEERKRIARELHDETSQDLATLLLSLETSVSSASEPLKERLMRMKALPNRTLDSIHRLIYDLRPSVLDDLGLPSAIRWVAESRLEPLGIDLTFEVVGTERRLKPEIETTLFRIGQEAISNIARHAEANSVRIVIEFGDRLLRLQVEDNGKGFEPEKVVGSADRAIGLLGMRERAALLDGAFTIYSEPGGGTRLTI